MPKYAVTLSRRIIVEVDAADEGAAMKAAVAMANDGNVEIEWDSDELASEAEAIAVEEISEPRGATSS
jgi:hypothetical protein